MGTESVLLKMIEYNAGDTKRILHFIKMHAFSALICELEAVDATTREIIEIAALARACEGI